MTAVRFTVPVLKVLQVFLATGGAQPLYGLELTEKTGLKSGTLYPVLARLEEAGWVTSAWEESDPRAVGRPRRRYYELTGQGQRAGAAELGQLALPLATKPQPQRPTARPAWGSA